MPDIFAEWIIWSLLDWAWKGFLGAAIVSLGVWLLARYRNSPWQNDIRGALIGFTVVAILVMALVLLTQPARTNQPAAAPNAALSQIQDTIDVDRGHTNLAVRDDRLKMSYVVLAEPNWPTIFWLTNRQDGFFLGNLTSPAPEGATVTWKAIPLPDERHRLSAQLIKQDDEFRSLQNQVTKQGSELNQAHNNLNQEHDENAKLTSKLAVLEAHNETANRTIEEIEGQDYLEQALKLAPNILTARQKANAATAACQNAQAEAKRKPNDQEVRVGLSLACPPAAVFDENLRIEEIPMLHLKEDMNNQLNSLRMPTPSDNH